MSGASERATMSALRPALTARACSPDAAYDWLNETSSPAVVFWNCEISSAYASRGVEYATSERRTSAERADAVAAAIAATMQARARAAALARCMRGRRSFRGLSTESLAIGIANLSNKKCECKD